MLICIAIRLYQYKQAAWLCAHCWRNLSSVIWTRYTRHSAVPLSRYCTALSHARVAGPNRFARPAAKLAAVQSAIYAFLSVLIPQSTKNCQPYTPVTWLRTWFIWPRNACRNRSTSEAEAVGLPDLSHPFTWSTVFAFTVCLEKRIRLTVYHNFGKICRPINKIVSLTDFWGNFV